LPGVAVHESYGETGMAHLLEHMLFKGSTGHTDILKELQDRGAQANGTTAWDRTNYFETFDASEDNLAWALDLERMAFMKGGDFAGAAED
jgi:zinc protease